MQFIVKVSLCSEHQEQLRKAGKVQSLEGGRCTEYDCKRRAAVTVLLLVEEPGDALRERASFGGASKSERKVAASRANGMRGGRPRKEPGGNLTS